MIWTKRHHITWNKLLKLISPTFKFTGIKVCSQVIKVKYHTYIIYNFKHFNYNLPIIIGFSMIHCNYLKFYRGSETGIFSMSINSLLLNLLRRTKKKKEKEGQKRGLIKLTYHVNLRKKQAHMLFILPLSFYLCFINVLCSNITKEFFKM